MFPAFVWFSRPSAWLLPPLLAYLPRSAVTLPHCAEETKWRRRRGPGARASAPPFAAPRPAVAPLAGGARALGPRLPPPPGRALSVGAPRAHTRTCGEHTPPSDWKHPAPRSRGYPPHLFSLSHSGPGFQESPRFSRRETSPPLSFRGAERQTPSLEPRP